MNILLADGMTLSDDACQQRKICGLPILICAVEEEGAWVNASALSEAVAVADDQKWIQSRVGPILIKDRAASALKSAGFNVTASSYYTGKTWQKQDGANTHNVQLQPDGTWTHTSTPVDRPTDTKNMAWGKGHASLSDHMAKCQDFQFAT